MLMFYDLDTRELLRTRPNPLTAAEIRRLRWPGRHGDAWVTVLGW
ncbi:hypothetical protein [Actinopolymorpha alba]|nr:hypothetical protein [Actinopolymorpha alba]